MLAANVIGDGPPPFVILSELKNLPSELEQFVASQQIYVGSTKSGYMTREMFTFWVICFINWLSYYRLTLPEAIRSKKALIICDGHTSRENPLALCLLRKANIAVIVLPSHTTHVLQMFDVGLA